MSKKKKKSRPFYGKVGKWTPIEIEAALIKQSRFNGAHFNQEHEILAKFNHTYRDCHISFCRLRTHYGSSGARYPISYHRAYIMIPTMFYYYVCKQYFDFQFWSNNKVVFEPTMAVRRFFSKLYNSKFIPWLSRSFIVSENSSPYLKKCVSVKVDQFTMPYYGPYISLQIYKNYDSIVRSLMDLSNIDTDESISAKLYMFKTIDEKEILMTLVISLIDKMYQFMEDVNNEEERRSKPFTISRRESNQKLSENT